MQGEHAVNQVSEAAASIREQTSRVLAGQQGVVEHVLVAMLSGGHVLLEGVPGVAKTLMARCMARLVGGTFARIQFTPDLMPTDVLGTSVFDLRSQSFHVRKGPVFANVVLADEINRAPAKTQSALLEAMQESNVTLDGTSHPLPTPFLVLATQNPVDQEGTYPLPEAALDRFFFKVDMGYPGEEEEIEILERHASGLRAPEEALDGLDPVLGGTVFDAVLGEVARVEVVDAIRRYIVRLVRATRETKEIRLGASPRAAVVLMTAARTLAALRGRNFVTPDDVQEVAAPALVHRMVLDPGAELEGLEPTRVLEGILAGLEVPR